MSMGEIKGQGYEMICKIYITNGHILWDVNAGGCKVNDTFKSGLNHMVGRPLSPVRRSGDQTDFNVQFTALFF